MRKIITATSLFGSLVFQGCIVNSPAWLSPADADAWKQAAQLALKPVGNNVRRIDDDVYDVFHSWLQAGFHPTDAFQGVKFANSKEYGLFFVNLPGLFSETNQVDVCVDLIGKFWINRPSWYIPTREEVSTVQDCVVSAISTLSEVDTPLEADHISARVLTSIASAVFSPKTRKILNSDENPVVPVTEDLSLMMKIAMTHPLLVRLVDEAIAHPNFASAEVSANLRSDIDWVMSETSGESMSDSALIHASDFLDNEGHEIATLPVWRQVFLEKNPEERIETLARLTAIKPEVVENAKKLQRMRFTNFRRGMGAAFSAWRETYGYMITAMWRSVDENGKKLISKCLPSAADVDLSSIRSVFELFEMREKSVVPFSTCFVGKMLAGQISIPKDEHFPRMVASLMFMIKITSDPLAMIAHSL